MDTYVKKAAKAAGTLCAAAGVISVAISGAALAVTLKSLKYAKDAFCKIMDDMPVKDSKAETESSTSETAAESNIVETVIVEPENIEAENDIVETTEEPQKNED